MVNTTDFINNDNLQKGMETLSIASKTLTDKLNEWIINQGFNVSPRWTSMLVLLIALGLIYIGNKVTKTILKWAIIVLALLLLLGLAIPIW